MSCAYIIVIYSPSLCADEAFENIPAPEPNNVDCRLIVSDDEYNRLPAATTSEAIDGVGSLEQKKAKAGSMATHAGGQTAWKIEDVSKRMQELLVETEHRPLDNILAEVDTFVQALKSHMSESQKESMKKVEDFLQGKTGVFTYEGQDLFGQQVNLDTLFKPTVVVDKDEDEKEGSVDQVVEGKKDSQPRTVNDVIDLTDWALQILAEGQRNAALGKKTTKDEPFTAQEDEWKYLLGLILETEDSPAAAGSASEKGAQDDDDKDNNGKTKPRT